MIKKNHQLEKTTITTRVCNQMSNSLTECLLIGNHQYGNQQQQLLV